SNLPQNIYDLGSEKASSSFDHRQRVVVSFIYRFPLANKSKGFVRALIGQWQAGGNFTAQSGAPFTVNIASDQANIGAGPAQRPNVSGNPNDGPKTPMGMVQHLRVLLARAVYVRERAPECCHWTGTARVRCFAAEGHTVH